MPRKKRKLVEWQEVPEDMMSGKPFDASDDWSEYQRTLANPDALPEAQAATPSTPQLLMGEAAEHLQGRQKEVYLLTMREGRSLAEAAEVLGISKGTAQKYMERAVKFITAYCKQAMAKGRV